MALKVLIACLSLLLALGLASCQRDAQGNVNAGASDPFAGASPKPDGVRRVTVDELRQAWERGDVVILDVRGTVPYNLGHIKGARNVPRGTIAQSISELPKDKLIVTYCA